MITENFKGKVLSRLTERYTTTDDFNIVLKDNVYSKYVEVNYKYKTGYSFEISLSNSGLEKVKYSPGSVMESESITVQKTNELEVKLNDWIHNIEQEMEVTPENRRLRAHEDKVKEIQERFENQEDSEFTYEEIDELKQRLDNLEQHLKAKIEEDFEKEEEYNKIINDLEQKIRSLKVQSNVLTKKNWLMSFSTKMYLYTQKHPKISTMLGTSIHGFLPEEIKNIFPKEYVEILLLDDGKKGEESKGKEKEEVKTEIS